MLRRGCLQIVALVGVLFAALWYEADESLARDICRVHNDGLAKIVAANSDRYVATR
jgi:hypothetical protein